MSQTGRSKTKKKRHTSSPAVGSNGAPNVTRSTEGDRKTGNFSEKLCITNNMGKRSFSLELTQGRVENRVLRVELNIEEKVEGKASVKLTVAALLHQANGVSCVMRTESSGAIKVRRGKMSHPRIVDADFAIYQFTPGSKKPGILCVEKKTNLKFVEMITAKYGLCIDDETLYYVAVTIVASNYGAELRVEVDGPVKKTGDQVVEDFFGFYEKMDEFEDRVSEVEEMKQVRISGEILSRILGR